MAGGSDTANSACLHRFEIASDSSRDLLKEDAYASDTFNAAAKSALG